MAYVVDTGSNGVFGEEAKKLLFEFANAAEELIKAGRSIKRNESAEKN